jgi:hypothetical protein
MQLGTLAIAGSPHEILVAGWAVVWVFGTVSVNQLPHWKDVVQVLTRVFLWGPWWLTALPWTVQSMVLKWYQWCPQEGSSRIVLSSWRPGEVLCSVVLILQMVHAILLVTVPAAAIWLELGQVAWKSGYLGQIIFAISSHPCMLLLPVCQPGS